MSRGFQTYVRALVLASLVAVALSAVSAAAHVPGLERVDDTDVVMPMGGPDVSRAHYGYLAEDERHDDYSFTVTEPVSRTVGIIVPAHETEDFRPRLTVKAAGDPPVLIESETAAPRVEWEPFSLMSFRHVGEEQVDFEPGRRYLLRVEPGRGADTGRYVIVFGGPEQFEAADIASTAAELPIIWYGAYGGAPFRWNWLTLIPLGVMVLAVGALVLGVLKVVRKHQA